MTPTGRDKNIDSVLRLFDVKIQITEDEIKDVVSSEAFNTIEQMSLIGLIKGLSNVISSGGTCFILTSFGLEVHRHGSWTKYLADKDEEKEASRQLIASSIRTNKLQSRLLWFTVGLTAITLIVSILDYSTHREELQLEQNRLLQTGETPNQQQAEKTHTLNSDSSKTSSVDSLQKKVK